jgi:hypothetical protein
MAAPTNYQLLWAATNAVTALRHTDPKTAAFGAAVDAAQTAVREMDDFAAEDDNEYLRVTAYRLRKVIDEIAQGVTA